MIKLSERLETIAGLVTPGLVLADIGTDHGYVPIYCVQAGITVMAYACDVNAGPLERAHTHIKEYGLGQQIVTKLSDGLQGLEDIEVQSIVIAGMGGPLMMRILMEGMTIVMAAKELILSPQSDLKEFRQFLQDNQLHILEERLVYEDGKYYPIIRCQYDNYELPKVITNPAIAYYGTYLLEHPNEVFCQYLTEQADKLTRLIDGMRERGVAKERMKERIEELTATLQALSYIGAR